MLGPVILSLPEETGIGRNEEDISDNLHICHQVLFEGISEK